MPAVPLLLDDVLQLLRDRGLPDLRGYRRSTLSRRLAARMNALALAYAPEAYLQRLEDDAKEARELFDALAVNVSAFFRDAPQLLLLANTLEATLQARAQAPKLLRAWSAGCASGEEAYTLAILLDGLRSRLTETQVLVFATDFDQAALEQAKRGRYERSALLETTLGVLDDYFEALAGEHYGVRPELRALVTFAEADLTSDESSPTESIFGDFDVILCRNVLIYMEAGLQRRLLSKLAAALAPDGLLALGPAETVPSDVPLIAVDERHGLYRRAMGAT